MESFDDVVSSVPVKISEIPQIGDDRNRRKVGIGEFPDSEIVPVREPENGLPEREPTWAAAAALLSSPSSAEAATGAAVTAAVAPPGPAPGPATPDVAAVVVEIVVDVGESRRPGNPVEVSVVVVGVLHRVGFSMLIRISL